MPITYRKRTYRKKTYVPKKKYAKKTTAVARNVNVRKDIHFFKRGSNLPTEIVGNAGYSSGLLQGVQTFSLDQVINNVEFTSLFDRYMITHCQLKIYMKVDPSAQTGATAFTPRIWWIKDYDDSSPSSISDMRQHAKVKSAPLLVNRPIVINIKPALLQPIYQSALVTAYGPKWNTWVDCNNNTVQHYGIKWAVDDLTNTNYRLQFETTYWFRCKDTR